MSAARFLVGDVFEQLATLPDDSVDLVMSSPPFLALRSYLPADHPDKGKEIGSEATPGEFIDTMLDVVEALDRVLAPHGSLVFELGDTYAGSGGAGGDYAEGGLRDGQPGFDGSMTTSRRRDGIEAPRQNEGGIGWPLDKSKALIPQLFAIALSYGFNPLTGRTTPMWRVRNVVAWVRPNPPVGRDGDKFRPATSYLTVATKARDRYWDGDAVRVPFKVGDNSGGGGGASSNASTTENWREAGTARLPDRKMTHNGAPLLDWWEIPTHGYRGAHYATFPPALVAPVVKSMCPKRVCTECGEPSRRITETTNAVGRAMGRASWRDEPDWAAEHHTGEITETASQDAPDRSERITLGWSDCGHDSWRRGIVLDPFGGSGTTGEVATGHGRDAILIDLDSRNADLARERLGMFLEVAP